MSYVLDHPTWRRLAAMEQEKASLGGRIWRQYVAECERILGTPWASIREGFNEIHLAERHDLKP